MAVQIVSVLLYHVLPQGAFTARELQAAGMVQTDLGTYLKESLPLTFATAGTGVQACPALESLSLKRGACTAAPVKVKAHCFRSSMLF